MGSAIRGRQLTSFDEVSSKARESDGNWAWRPAQRRRAGLDSCFRRHSSCFRRQLVTDRPTADASL